MVRSERRCTSHTDRDLARAVQIALAPTRAAATWTATSVEAPIASPGAGALLSRRRPRNSPVAGAPDAGAGRSLGWPSWQLVGRLELPAGLDGRRRRIRRGGYPSHGAAAAVLARLPPDRAARPAPRGGGRAALVRCRPGRQHGGDQPAAAAIRREAGHLPAQDPAHCHEVLARWRRPRTRQTDSTPKARIASIDDIADALADLSQSVAATLADAASHALDPSDRAACTRPPALLDANSVRRQSNRPGSSVHLGQRPA